MIARIPNSVEAVVLEFALARIGACVAPLPMPWREHELDFVAGQTQAAALITVREHQGFEHLALARSLQERHPCIRQMLLLGTAAEGTVSLSERWDNPLTGKVLKNVLRKQGGSGGVSGGRFHEAKRPPRHLRARRESNRKRRSPW